MKPYIIQNKSENSYWSNEDGWVDVDSATKFSEKEILEFNLPTDGKWITLWEINSIQFSRFIAECEGFGVFENEERMEQVAEQMDLDIDELYQIISRAQYEFAKFCKSL